jgi:TPR repeat protein
LQVNKRLGGVMKKVARFALCRWFSLASLLLCAGMISAQSGSAYDALIQQAKDLLRGGSADQALTLSQASIKISPERWEAYDLAGQALLKLHRNNEATLQFSQAIVHAPDSQQAGIRTHLGQSVQPGGTKQAEPVKAKAAPAATVKTPAKAQSTTVTALKAPAKAPSGIAAIEKQADALETEKKYPEALALYLQAANRGSAKSQDEVGRMYANGWGVTKDYTQAMTWYQKAAAQGNARAQYGIGLRYLYGQGVDKDYTQAMTWFQKAATKADADAQFFIGYMYEAGWGVTKDYTQAMTWFQKAAAQGNAGAQYRIGNLYNGGQGVTQDYAQAMTWYQKAAAQGFAGAQYNIGWMYETGRGVPKDYAQALSWYQKSADQGDSSAQYIVGRYYQGGFGVAKDYAQAMIWYQKAAAQGNARAQCDIGSLYEEGLGVATDYAQAFTWFQEAAVQGNAAAQYFVGLKYEYGKGVAKDYAQAMAWYQKAAAQGHPVAQFYIGGMYENGLGVAKDETQAFSWYQKAAAQGSADAKAAIARLEAPKPPEDLTKLDLATLMQRANAGDPAAETEMGHRYSGGANTLSFSGKTGEKPIPAGGFSSDDQAEVGQFLGLDMKIEQRNSQALFWYQKAAAQNYPPAIERLGYMSEDNKAQAMSYFQKAAAMGNSTANVDIGIIYIGGFDAPQDIAKGMTYLQKAAAQGNASANYLIGAMYFYGSGVNQDSALGLSLVRKAAAQKDIYAVRDLPIMEAKGHPLQTADIHNLDKSTLDVHAQAGEVAAQIEFGDRYMTGRNCGEYHICEIDKSPDMARFWYQKAADQGDQTAISRLAAMNSPAQNADAQTAPADTPKKSKWGSFFGAVNTLASVAQGSMQVSSDLNSLQHGGGVTALVNTVSDTVTANNNIENSGNGDTVANITDTLQKTQSMVSIAQNSGGAPSSGGSSNARGTAACSTSQPYATYYAQCSGNPLSQAPCYQAAAALCQCYINADPTNSSVGSWRQCVTSNTASANALRSSASTVQ